MSWFRKHTSDTGWRDITIDVPGRVSGTVTLRRVGSLGMLRFVDLIVAEPGTNWATFAGLLPAGFRMAALGFTYMPIAQYASVNSAGPVRFDRFGNVVVYDMAGGKRASGLVSFPVDGAFPAESEWPVVAA